MKNLYKRLVSFTVFFAANFVAFSQVPTIEWQRSFGGSNTDIANSLYPTIDGGYIIAGYTTSNNGDVSVNNGFDDYWVIKLDSLGNKQWEKSYGGSQWDRANSIQQTNDGGFVLVGTGWSNDGDASFHYGNGDYWVVKLDNLGNIEWQQSYGGTGWEWAYSIVQTSDDGYIITGGSNSNDGLVSGFHGGVWDDAWILKLDSQGSVVWQRALGGSGQERLRSIQQTSDSGYILAGWSNSIDGDVVGNHGDYDCWIVKLDSTGSIIWQKSFGGSNYDYSNSISQTLDGGFIVGGYTASIDGDVNSIQGGEDVWILKLDSSGMIEWKKTIGGSGDERCWSVEQTSDNGFIVGGYSNSSDGDVSGNHGNDDCWVVKLNEFGNVIWERSLGGSVNEYLSRVTQIRDNEYIVAAMTNSFNGDVTHNNGDYDYWIVKLNSTVGLQSHVKETNRIWPNPSNGILHFECIEEKAEFELFDFTGKLIQKSNFSEGRHIVNISDQNSGIYFYRINSNNQVLGGKLVRR